MDKNYSVSYNSENNTLFVYDRGITFVIDFNSGTFKRVTKNKHVDDVCDESVDGLLECKKWLEELEKRKNKILEDAETFESLSKRLSEDIRKNIKEHPNIK